MKLDEKWRPKTLDDCVGNDHNIKLLKAFASGGDFPHMIFHGPPGGGKTTAAKAFVADHYGKSLVRVEPLQIINAASERGIDKIRELRESLQYTFSDPKKLKIVIFDEADGLTKDAMFALKAVMEVPSIAKRVRFIYTLNNPNHLIDPIHSRCKAMYFGPWTDNDLHVLGRKIADKESIEISNENLMKVVKYCKGDARRLIVEYLEDFRMIGKVDDVAMKRFVGEEEIVAAVLSAMDKGDTKKDKVELAMRVYEAVRMQRVINHAAFIEHVLRTRGVDAVEACAEIDHRLNQGCTEFVQMLYLFSELV